MMPLPIPTDPVSIAGLLADIPWVDRQIDRGISRLERSDNRFFSGLGRGLRWVDNAEDNMDRVAETQARRLWNWVRGGREGPQPAPPAGTDWNAVLTRVRENYAPGSRPGSFVGPPSPGIEGNPGFVGPPRVINEGDQDFVGPPSWLRTGAGDPNSPEFVGPPAELAGPGRTRNMGSSPIGGRNRSMRGEVVAQRREGDTANNRALEDMAEGLLGQGAVERQAQSGRLARQMMEEMFGNEFK